MRFRPSPALFAVPALGYAALLVYSGTSRYLLTAALLAAYAVAYLLPWRVPRDDRTPFGYWFETLVCTIPLVSVTVTWLARDPSGARAGPPSARPVMLWLPVWLVVAFGAGIVVVLLSGVDLRALRAGDLAFLAGPLPLNRMAARTWTVGACVVSEEVIFRGVPDGVTAHRWPALIVGAVAFISGHHMVRGAQDRLRWRVVENEAGAAVLLGGLVVLSGSVWPAVVTHAVADVPHVALDIQRVRARLYQGQWGSL